MQSWYCRDFMSSSQTAAKLVFNIENCVDMGRVLNVRPNRPPDSQGRESFVYLMDGSAARNVKDLTIDDLSPWNSRKCKSSTRFSSVQFDNERNSLIFNRFIISDTSSGSNTPPDCLFACYYCKHPLFDLVKKIFYACDGNRERCLSGTFVIFVYEFNKAEQLYRTQRYLSQKLISKAEAATAAVHSSSSSAHFPGQVPTCSAQIPNPTRHFLDNSAPLKLENFSHWAEQQPSLDGQLQQQQNANAYDFDAFFATHQQEDMAANTSTSLEEILQSCTEAVQQQQMANASANGTSSSTSMPKLAAPSSSTSTTLLPQDKPGRKRRKITFRALEQPPNNGNGGNNNHFDPHSIDFGKLLMMNTALNNNGDFMMGRQSSSPSSLTPAGRSPAILSSGQSECHDEGPATAAATGSANGQPCKKEEEEEEELLQHVFTSDALLENFRRNCLCEGRKLGEQLEAMDEHFLWASSEEDRATAIREAEAHAEPGGCLLVDSDFPLGTDLRATILWFRNAAFLDQHTRQPVLHPVAVHLAQGGTHQPSARHPPRLLQELQARLDDYNRGEESANAKHICRAVIVRPSPSSSGANADELDNSRWSSLLDSAPIFAFPCVRLVSPEQSKQWLRHKFAQLAGTNPQQAEADFAERIESELFWRDSGVLESLSFEQFLGRQRAVEKGWPNAFRSWFREKSGWIFEHCSLGSRLKAGFRASRPFDLDAALEPLREDIRQSFAATVVQQQSEGGQVMVDDLETAIEALELICTEFLQKALNALLEPMEQGRNTSSSSTTLQQQQSPVVPAKRISWIGREQWEQLSVKERRDWLSPMGLSSLLNVADSLDPALFWGMGRVQKRELVARASALTVVEVPGQEMCFAVLDMAKGMASFTSANAKDDGQQLYCECQRGMKASKPALCEHILAAALKHSNLAKLLPRLMLTNQQQQQRNEGSSIKNEMGTAGLQLDSCAQSLEIICCSSSTGGSSL